nr:CBO0543 family protein [Cohnella pontilimi]
MDRNILFILWFVCVTSIYFLVPRAKAHAFLMCFLACQAVGWPVELLLVQFDGVAYPLREFPKASDLSITVKLVWTPVASGLFYIYIPRKSRTMKFIYFAAWVSFLTLIDGLLAAHTRLVKHVHVHWSLIALVFAFLLLCVSGIVTWFFKKPAVFREEVGDS